MKLKKFVQTIVSMIAVLGFLYVVSQYETAMWVVGALCVAMVSAVGVIKFNEWIFGEVPVEEKPKKVKKVVKPKRIEKPAPAVQAYDYESEEELIAPDCATCDEATCEGCVAYETDKYNIDDIVKEFHEATERLEANGEFSMEDLV